MTIAGQTVDDHPGTGHGGNAHRDHHQHVERRTGIRRDGGGRQPDGHDRDERDLHAGERSARIADRAGERPAVRRANRHGGGRVPDHAQRAADARHAGADVRATTPTRSSRTTANRHCGEPEDSWCWTYTNILRETGGATLTVTAWEINLYDTRGRACSSTPSTRRPISRASTAARPACPPTERRTGGAVVWFGSSSGGTIEIMISGDGHLQPAVPVRVDAASVGTGKTVDLRRAAPGGRSTTAPPPRPRGRAVGARRPRATGRLDWRRGAARALATTGGQEIRRRNLMVFLLISWPSCKVHRPSNHPFAAESTRRPRVTADFELTTGALNSDSPRSPRRRRRDSTPAISRLPRPASPCAWRTTRAGRDRSGRR